MIPDAPELSAGSLVRVRREQLDESTRLTWAEDTRDEVLARLLELNRVMAEREAREAAETDGAAGRKPRKKRGSKEEATLALPLSRKGEG